MNPTVAQSGIDLFGIGEGSAILLIGILGLLLYALITFRNPAGLALWSFTVVLVTVSALFNLGIELVWIGIMFTAVLTIVGVTARVVR